MIYMGSKNRIAKYILPFIIEESEITGKTNYIEPFVGGGNMIDKVPDRLTRTGYDICSHTIIAMKDIRDRAESLPENVTKEEYDSITKTPPSPTGSWIRIVCSFGGRLDNGYARASSGYNYAAGARRSAIRQSKKLQGVSFICDSFLNIDVNDSIIYCDPPYKGTTGYKGDFSHDEFYEWCRKMKSKGNSIFVSEYDMPSDFKEIWRGEIKTGFASGREKATHVAVEKLFKL